ncbi:MAG: prolyl oligopeptidase family serine peptidase [Vicinamibacteria bacterium]
MPAGAWALLAVVALAFPLVAVAVVLVALLDRAVTGPPRPSRMSARRAAAAALVLGCAAPPPGDPGAVRAAPPRVHREAVCAPLPPHEGLDAFGRRYFDRPEWERARRSGVECRQLTYESDGFEVNGYVLAPATAGRQRLPAIIYNRGGTGDYGRIDPLTLAEMGLLAEEGFVVAASDYRYVGSLSRRDEWGGAEVADVTNLLPLLAARSDVDARDLFMLGVSRGGLMTYLAIRRGAPLRAAAVIAGPTDLTRFAVDRPEFVAGDDDYDGWARIWPDYARRAREHLEARSPVCWPGEVKVPVLILHSRTDRMVAVEHALALAGRLQEVGREYELVVYGDDGHSLPRHREDRNRRILEWFRSHRAP